MKTFDRPTKAIEEAGGGDLESLVASGRIVVVDKRGKTQYRVPGEKDWLVFSRSSREMNGGPFSTKKKALRSIGLSSTERRIKAGLYVADAEHIVGRRVVAAEEGFRAWPEGEDISPQNEGLEARAEQLRTPKPIKGLSLDEALALNSALCREFADIQSKLKPEDDGSWTVHDPYQ